MKHLWLIRHATAIQGDFSLADFDRTLEVIGLKEARKSGEFILAKNIIPDLILSSPSKRTLETTTEVNSAIGKSIPVEAIVQLYNANFQVMLHCLKNLDPKINIVAMVAHNPGISQLATALASKNSFQMAPSAAVCLQFSADDWNEIGPGSGKEIYYYYP
ncbi:MAG TPA: histidine phosphatase family protein [Catalimonadaceae bacterium]|nr:histidine phosphatase family protein [Catalimonadaceae bacterium]